MVFLDIELHVGDDFKFESIGIVVSGIVSFECSGVVLETVIKIIEIEINAVVLAAGNFHKTAVVSEK